MSRKRTVTIAFALISVLVACHALGRPIYAQPRKALTNQDVVQMVKAGFDDQTVVKVIQANETQFDVSPEALLALKNTGVSQTVIQAMLSRATANGNGSAASPATGAEGSQGRRQATNPNDPKSPHPAGIYWQSTAGQSTELVELRASTYSGGKTSGMFGAAMSMGFSKAKWKVVVSGAHATLHIPEGTPEFWFYFSNAGSSFSSGPSSPDDFTLVKLERHDSDRELVVGKVGAFGASNGVPPKDTVAVKSKQLAQGIYEVNPTGRLEPGEYAFVPAGENMVLSSAGGKLFDFEVVAAH